MEVPEDAELSAAIRELAQKSAEFGRFFAITPMKTEDRARVVKAGQGIPGTRISVEGEGRSRRVVFTPDNPKPMPKQRLPQADHDEEELAGGG
jgi:hypothetical protein